MDWEHYLNAAVDGVGDKYQARRYKAHFRAQLLERYDRCRAQGLARQDAMSQAMQSLGDPQQLAKQVSEPIAEQRDWLWVLSVAQLVVGVFIVALSMRTQAFAAVALGRIMALWGVVSTGVQTRRSRSGDRFLPVLRIRIRRAGQRLPGHALQRMAGVGFATGILLALVASLPWNLLSANMFHPVFVSTAASLMLSGVVVALPWIRVRRWLGSTFYLVTLQAGAALCAAIAATAVILWHQGLTPPPLYNWQPEMLVMAGWLFNFGLLRVVTTVTTFKERVLVGFDEDRRTLF